MLSIQKSEKHGFQLLVSTWFFEEHLTTLQLDSGPQILNLLFLLFWSQSSNIESNKKRVNKKLYGEYDFWFLNYLDGLKNTVYKSLPSQ